LTTTKRKGPSFTMTIKEDPVTPEDSNPTGTSTSGTFARFAASLDVPPSDPPVYGYGYDTTTTTGTTTTTTAQDHKEENNDDDDKNSNSDNDSTYYSDDGGCLPRDFLRPAFIITAIAIGATVSLGFGLGFGLHGGVCSINNNPTPAPVVLAPTVAPIAVVPSVAPSLNLGS
jgi:hypothetical protein